MTRSRPETRGIQLGQKFKSTSFTEIVKDWSIRGLIVGEPRSRQSLTAQFYEFLVSL